LFLQSKFGEEWFQKLRKLVLWTMDKTHNLEGILNPSTKVPSTKDGKVTVQFCYPSPGNRKPVQIPTADENDNNPYFVAHYVRDTTRQGTDPVFPHPELESAHIVLLSPDHPMVEELKAKLAGAGV